MILIVERIADSFVLLEKEDKTHLRLAPDVLPDEIREGSVIVFEDGEYRLAPDEEQRLRRIVAEKQKSLFKKK